MTRHYDEDDDATSMSSRPPSGRRRQSSYRSYSDDPRYYDRSYHHDDPPPHSRRPSATAKDDSDPVGKATVIAGVVALVGYIFDRWRKEKQVEAERAHRRRKRRDFERAKAKRRRQDDKQQREMDGDDAPEPVSEVRRIENGRARSPESDESGPPRQIGPPAGARSRQGSGRPREREEGKGYDDHGYASGMS